MPAGFSWLAARLVQGMVATMRVPEIISVDCRVCGDLIRGFENSVAIREHLCTACAERRDAPPEED